MEKTIRYFLLIMIITGTIFTYGCFHDDLFKSDVEEMTEGEVEAEEGADSDDEAIEEEGAAEKMEAAAEELATSPQPVEEDAQVVEVTTEVEASATLGESPAPEEPAAPVEELSPAPAEKPAPVAPPAPVEESAPAEEPAEPAPVEETSSAEEQGVYQNGTFTSDGNYFSPNGPESISVTLTLDNDVVTSLMVMPHGTHEKSMMFQGAVRDNAPALVVGKKLDEIGAFSKISTSSLTPNGFNQAIASIKASAKN